MNLVLLDRQGLEFVVVSDDRGGAFGGFCGTLGVRSGALTPSRAIAVGQLRYREDSLRIAFRPLLAGHRGEQAQIVTFDGETATPRLEVADGAMPVQNERRRLPTVAGRPDRVDDLARPGDVVRDLHGFSAVTIAVDQCSGVCQNPGDLRQRERTETHEQAVGNVRLVPGQKQDGDKGAGWR